MSIIGVVPGRRGDDAEADAGTVWRPGPLASRGVNADDGLAVLMIFAYFTAVVEDRSQHPTDDLASVLANALVDGQPMERLDQISYFIITATAGHDTISATISGGMKALLNIRSNWKNCASGLSC
ncbi:MAG: hypothetical protein IPG64_13750 [Haliea sp.]|nr:hypothetical protein [Haliea sp.]